MLDEFETLFTDDFDNKALDLSYLCEYQPLAYIPDENVLCEEYQILHIKKPKVLPRVSSFFSLITLRNGLLVIGITQFIISCFSLYLHFILLPTLQSIYSIEKINNNLPFLNPSIILWSEFTQTHILTIDLENPIKCLFDNQYFVYLRLFLSLLSSLYLLQLLREFTFPKWILSGFCLGIDFLLSLFVFLIRLFHSIYNKFSIRYMKLVTYTFYFSLPLFSCLSMWWISYHVFSYVTQQYIILCHLALKYPKFFGTQYYKDKSNKKSYQKNRHRNMSFFRISLPNRKTSQCILSNDFCLKKKSENNEDETDQLITKVDIAE